MRPRRTKTSFLTCLLRTIRGDEQQWQRTVACPVQISHDQSDRGLLKIGLGVARTSFSVSWKYTRQMPFSSDAILRRNGGKKKERQERKEERRLLRHRTRVRNANLGLERGARSSWRLEARGNEEEEERTPISDPSPYKHHQLRGGSPDNQSHTVSIKTLG